MSKSVIITDATYLDGYKISITFNDSKTHVVDFESFLTKSRNEQIRKYLNIDMFKSFKIVDGDLDWNDFDLCFPIHDLYTNSIDKFSVESEKTG